MNTNNDKPTSIMPKLSKLEYFALIIAANNKGDFLFNDVWADDSIEMAEILLEQLEAKKQRRAR